ncbi:hypothetical protein O1611_g7576 [Lasiodiplodia mahajangana]|uniref:Uncharacterized protein n=1 Tax=Lasiodiplodia mahajangana TaxID=1108764 RepID=A0ACC2JF58_9PEZI|nr:hypothetical protein O1611_g7576 [Lasiodiplodia mahajangana]
MEDNVEDNVEASLPVRDLDSKTPLWQHDNAWVRVPAQWLHRGRDALREASESIGLGALLSELIFSEHIIFILLLIGFGIWLAISISRGRVSPAPLVVELVTVGAWAIYAGAKRRMRKA